MGELHLKKKLTQAIAFGGLGQSPNLWGWHSVILFFK